MTTLFTRTVALYTTVALVAHVVAVPAAAGEQSAMTTRADSARTTVEDIQVVFSGGVVTITYDLTGFEGQRAFDVALEVSTNGGQTYDVQPRSMNGNVGRPVSAGRGKRIVWEFAKDVESLHTSQFRFRVVIRVETRPGAAAAIPPAVPTAARVSAGNPLFWPGLEMFGAGVALAALAGAGPLRQRTPYRGYYELTPNKAGIYGGIGVAATGLVLLFLGRRGAAAHAAVFPIPGGVMLYRAATF